LQVNPDTTHWAQHKEADEINHSLIDFLLNKLNVQVIR
jgi:hypothetical protein